MNSIPSRRMMTELSFLFPGFYRGRFQPTLWARRIALKNFRRPRGIVVTIFRTPYVLDRDSPNARSRRARRSAAGSWSGQSGSNRRHSAWEADVLPLNYARTAAILTNPEGADKGQRSGANERRSRSDSNSASHDAAEVSPAIARVRNDSTAFFLIR